MGLHTATNGQSVNKYDGGTESLIVEPIIFDATYKGTAVDFVKELCVKSYGGELLASKATKEALLRSKKGGDEVSVQRLGECNLPNIRKVELIELIPRDLPTRIFPARSFVTHNKQMDNALVENISNAPSTPSRQYDPFPSSKHDQKQEYDSMVEREDSSHSDNESHSSTDDKVQHNPRISRRRPSISQFVGGPDSHIEVSFDAPNDEEDLSNYLSVQPEQTNFDSDHSIDPPKQHKSRIKRKEVEKRKSVIAPLGLSEVNLQKLKNRNDAKQNQSGNSSKKHHHHHHHKKRKKKTRKYRKSGRDGDDEESVQSLTPLPGEEEYGNNQISKPKRAPRTNKKMEHHETMVGIQFDPDADSSVYSAGSRSIRTATSIRSKSTALNSQSQLKLFKMRPPNLPSAYSDDKEFTCLCCQQIKKWIDGVWRVPMWPSFDVCIECGNKELQTGTSKKETDNFDPTNTMAMNTIYSPQNMHNNFGDLSDFRTHRKVPSNQPLMKSIEYMESMNAKELKMSQETLEMLRKELSDIVEKLTDQKVQRLDSLAEWSKDDENMQEFRSNMIDEKKVAEDEIHEWRQKAKKLDVQDQRVLRRKNTVPMDSPNAYDLESDEELHQNWQDYDYKEDFAVIHSRLKDLNSLFWHEDNFFLRKYQNMQTKHKHQFKELQAKYSQTTHELQQKNEALTEKYNELQKNSMQIGKKPARDYHNILNNGDHIDDYSEDDLDNDNIERYGKYVPPSVKHIHENSQALNGVKLEHIVNEEMEQRRQNDGGDGQYVIKLEEQIDNYIKTVNRKDRQLRATQQIVNELKDKVKYVWY